MKKSCSTMWFTEFGLCLSLLSQISSKLSTRGLCYKSGNFGAKTSPVTPTVIEGYLAHKKQPPRGTLQ